MRQTAVCAAGHIITFNVFTEDGDVLKSSNWCKEHKDCRAVPTALKTKHVGHDVTFDKGGLGGRCFDCHEDLTVEQGEAVRSFALLAD